MPSEIYSEISNATLHARPTLHSTSPSCAANDVGSDDKKRTGDVCSATRLSGQRKRLVHHSCRTQKLIGAYEGFRSVVLHEGLKQPVWVCSESTYPKIAEHTCSEEDLSELLNRLRRTGFVIQKEPCIRFDWVVTPSKNCLVITNHHLLFDGWGKQQLLRDFMRLVEYPQHFLPEKLNRHWYEGWSQLDHPAAIQAYSNYLRPFETFAEITSHRGEKAESAVVSHDLPRQGLDALAKTWGFTPAEALNFTWACFAAEWTQEQHVQFGVVKQKWAAIEFAPIVWIGHSNASMPVHSRPRCIHFILGSSVQNARTQRGHFSLRQPIGSNLWQPALWLPDCF